MTFKDFSDELLGNLDLKGNWLFPFTLLYKKKKFYNLPIALLPSPNDNKSFVMYKFI